MTWFRTTRLALFALVLAVSCKSGDGGVAGVLVVSRVDVEPGITQVILGQSLQFSATPRTASGITVPGRAIAWSSTDPLIATVSNTGMVNGVALGGPVRIRATVDGVVGDALVTVRSVPVDRVTVTPANSGVLVAAGVQLTAHAFDAEGNPLIGRSFEWGSSAPAIAAVTTTGIVIGLTQGGPVTITATAEGKSGSALVSVATRPATRLAFAEQPGPAVSGAPLTPPIRVLLQDDLLTTVIGAANPVTISLAGNPGGATLGGTTTINATSGIATFSNLTLDRPATGYTFLVTSPGLIAATSTPFNVVVGAASRLVFSTPLPGSAQSGVAFAPQPVLQLVDASGNLVARAGVAVTAALGTAGGTLAGSTVVTTNSAGAAAFSGLTLSGPSGSYSVSFSATDLTSVSGLVTLGAGAAGSLAIAVQPTSSAQSGVALSTQPAIQLKDAAGNNVGQAGVVITASIASGTGTLGGATTATTNSAGLAQFASLAINGPSGNYTLQFSAPGSIAPVTSSTIVLGAGAPTQLTIVTQPSAAAQSGVAFATQPGVQLRDGGGNPVNVSGIQVTASIASGGGTLSGATTATTNASGVATFTNLAISGTVGPRTLSFTSAGLTSATSGTITLSAGPAAALGLNTQPSPSGSSGVALAQQPVVQIRDAAGNPVSQNGVLVTATIASGPAGATLGGNVATTAGFGAATFTSLAITGPSGTYTIQFSAPGLTSVTSGGVTLGAGAATQLFIATQPSSTAQSGAALAQQPQIQLRDASNNPVAQAGVVVTATIASGGGTLGGSTTATTNASGLASFTNLSISGVIGGRTLGFSAPGLAGATSGTITLSAGAASQLSISTQPSNLAQSGVPFPTQPVIQLRDAAGNAVSQAGVNVTAAIASGGGTLGGTATVATNASGVASFAGLSITGTAGDRTLGFSAPGLTGATSAVVSVTAGAPSNLAITTQPSSTAQNGVAFAQQPVIQLRDASNNPVSQAGVVVTAVIASGGGTLGGTTTATTNASGVASFTNLSITGTTGARTLSFSAPSYNSVTSGTITLSAGAATQLVITTQPASSAQSGVVFAPQPVLQLRDLSGNNVSQAGVMVTAAIGSGGGTLGGTTTVATSGTGAATFAGLSISGTIGARTLDFSAAGLTGATSGSINLTAGPASQLSITTQPSGTAQSGVAFAQQPAIQLRDAAGNPVGQAGVAITASLASSPGGGTLNGSTIAATNGTGLATFTNLSLSGTSGNYTLGFSSGSLAGTTSSAINLSAGAGSKLAIATQPSATTPSGAVFAQQPVIQLQDGSGNPVADAGVQVTVTIQTGGGTLGGSTTATTNGSGVASFTNLSITGTTGVRTLLFSAAGYVSVASNDINVTAGAATQLTITTQPSGSAQSGTAFAQQPVLQLRDASGNPVPQAGVSVTAAIASGGGTLGGTTSVQTDAGGTASFSGLSISGAPGGRTLSFSAPGVSGATSGTISISAAPATQLSITTQPSTSAVSGAAFAQQPVLQLRDGGGNPVSQSGVVVTAAIASGGGTLGGTTTASTDGNGVATFTNLSITGAPGDRTLDFSAPSLTGATSGTISITAPAATQLTITTQPSASAVSGAAFAQQPVLQLRDGGGNPVSQSGVVVTAAIASGGGTLGGTTTASTDGNGVATFTNLSITGAPGDRTLDFSAPSLTGATSGTISITAPAATQLTITTQPSASAVSGAAFAQQPVLQLRDGGGNPVSQSGVVVTAAIASGGGTLGGTTTASTDGNGVATFTNLSITGAPGDRTLDFSAPSLTGATSSTISITAPAATQLTITTQPSASAASGAAFAQQPVLQLRDGGGNPVSQSGVVVTAAIASGGGTLGGTTTASTDGNGVATFTDLSITGAPGDRTLDFSAPSLTGATSSTISITAPAATQLTITTQPSASAQSGAAFAQQPVLQLRDGGGNPVSQSGVVVTAAIASGGGTLGGTATATTDGNGVATFTDLSITGSTGDRTLGFSATGLTGATSGTISVTSPAGASQLAISQQPVGGASGAALATQPIIAVQDAQGGTVTTDNTTQVSVGISSGAGGSLGGTQTVQAASGLATFTNLTLAGTVGVNYVLRFTSSPAFTPVNSGNVTVTAGSATNITITTEPGDAASGATLSPAVVQLRDANGNAALVSGIPINVAFNPGGSSSGTLTGTLTVPTDPSGAATFSDLVITGPGMYKLRFTSGTLNHAISVNISIS